MPLKVTVAVATLVSDPASTSAWVAVWTTVAVVVAPGASERRREGHGPSTLSMAVRAESVTLPVFAMT